MESWRYGSGDKGFVPNNNDTLPPLNTLPRSKNSSLGWELKAQPSFSNQILASAQQHLEPEMLGKQLSNDPLGYIMNDPNSSSGGEDSASKILNSVVESNSRDSLIDLKLGRVGDQRDANESPFSKCIPLLCSSESSATPKRVRTSGVLSQTAHCQVLGCNKDLSASKDYHKRHKVCDVHSKTAKVIVNGIEQRFCQQCSSVYKNLAYPAGYRNKPDLMIAGYYYFSVSSNIKFHLLGEFDDAKRSCRKRLAGHNERRRKPKMGTHSGKGRRLLQSCNGSRFQGSISMLTAASFICQEILPGGGGDNWCKPIRVQGGNDFRHISSIPLTSRSLLPSKQYQLPNEIGAVGSIFCDNNNQYLPALGESYSGPPSSCQDTFLGSEYFNVFDTASTIQGLSGCALSLLSSSQSQNLSIPIGRPVVTPSSHGQYSLSHASENIMGMISSQASTGMVSAAGSFTSQVNHADGGRFGPALILDNNETVNLEIADGIFQGSDVVNMKVCEHGPTVDSQLHRVEHQRQSLQVKQENDSFCSLRIT